VSGYRRNLAVLVSAAALMAAGCGGDSEETASAPLTTAPAIAPPTAPAPTTTKAPVATTAPTTAAAPKPTPAAPTSAPNACETSKAISRLKFQGIPCEQAAGVADEWDRMQDRCSTIDNPDSPEGYNRTCTVQSYTCTAKRDVKSDSRFVACAKGPAQIRFTWAPP
jgi:hypothetical protein